MTYVVATAGHVDHGKSALVEALTGMPPDRWAEERRRGLTIDLGFAWTRLPSGAELAFVDVPGHERFIGNMLAGVGAVPAVVFVVAADEGWSAQSAEHLAAVAALGVRHGLLVVTKSDLADPGPAREQARAALAGTGLEPVESIAVSSRTGAGLDALRAALDRLVAALPGPDPEAPVRLWIDRAFTVRGAGTVVTGTLPAGSLRAGDTLTLASRDEPVVVRGLHSLGRPVDEAAGVSRVAVNLRQVPVSAVRRGDALLTPGGWQLTELADVRVDGGGDLPRELRCHLGAAAVTARVRPLAGDTVRLGFGTGLPLHVADRLLLRDPGSRRVWGATVLDPAPPALRRRGAARERAGLLAGEPDARAVLRWHGVARTGQLRAWGLTPPYPPVVGDWLADPEHWAALAARLSAELVSHPELAAMLVSDPLPAAEELRRRLDLPDRRLAEVLVASAGGAPGTASSTSGHTSGAASGQSARPGDRGEEAPGPVLPPLVRAAADAVLAELVDAPYAAPPASRLATLGLDRRALAAAASAGALLHLGAGLYLAPGADARATALLAALPQPFTVSQARAALRTSRRVAVPLLELLDRQGHTERLDDAGLRRTT